MTRAHTTAKILAALAIVIVIVAIIVLTARAHSANTRRCHNMGGTVTVDHDTSRVYNRKTGKYETHIETEHECIVNGQEAFEW